MNRTGVLSEMIVLCFFIAVQTFAQESKSVEITGEIRLRAEIDDRDFNQHTLPYNYNLLRTRLNFKKYITKNILAFVQLQDSRTYGAEGVSPEAATRKSIDNLDLHLGYVRLENFLLPRLSLQFGRMELSYSDQRLLSRNGWSNSGRAFDGFLTSLALKGATVDLFAASLYESQAGAFKAPPQDDGDFALFGLWAKINSPKTSAVNVYLLHDKNFQKNAADKPSMLRTTAGTLVQGNYNRVRWSFEGNYQFGTMDYTADISAFYIAASIGYSFNSLCKPAVSVGYDVLSGDDPDTKKYETFNTLYPSRHRYFGYMDYFRDFPADVQGGGINDFIFSAFLTPAKNVGLKMDAHLFQLSQSTEINEGKNSQSLGNELDLTLNAKMNNHVSILTGCSLFQPGGVFKVWKGSDHSFWYFAQIGVTF